MKRLVVLAGVLLAGTGAAMADPCVINPVVTYNPSDTAVSLLFDSFQALPNNSGTCDFSISAHEHVVNNPDLFEVYSADVRGEVPLAGDEGSFSIAHNGRNDAASGLTGVGSLTTYYAGKEGDGTIRSRARVSVSVATDPLSEVDIDSIDYALIATMTRADAEASLESVGQDQAGLITHLDASSGLLTSNNLPLEGENEFGFFGGAGSFMLGGRGRYNLGEGFSILAGLSIIDQSPGAHYAGVLGAAALRYVDPDAIQSFRQFGEVGVDAGALGLQFSRSYSDSNGTHDVSGTGSAGLVAAYVRGGFIVATDVNNQIVLSASLKQNFLGFFSYQEPLGAGNLFAADLSGKIQGFTTAKLGADWTTQLATDVTLTSSLAVGSTFGNNGTQAYIFGGGDVSGVAPSTLFVDYGLNLGWKLSDSAHVDGFAQGSTGTGIGTHVQVGAAYSTSF